MKSGNVIEGDSKVAILRARLLHSYLPFYQIMGLSSSPLAFLWPPDAKLISVIMSAHASEERKK